MKRTMNNQPFPTRLLGISTDIRNTIYVIRDYLCKTNPILQKTHISIILAKDYMMFDFTNHENKSKTPPQAVQINNQSFNNQLKGKPNLTINQSRPKAESTNNQSSIIDNQLKAPHKAHFSSKIAKNTRLLQFLDPNTLNSMYNKDLHNFSPQNTLHKRSLPVVCLAGKNAKRTQSQPPTYEIRYTQYKTIYAKRTQLQ